MIRSVLTLKYIVPSTFHDIRRDFGTLRRQLPIMQSECNSADERRVQCSVSERTMSSFKNCSDVALEGYIYYKHKATFMTVSCIGCDTACTRSSRCMCSASRLAASITLRNAGMSILKFVASYILHATAATGSQQEVLHVDPNFKLAEQCDIV